MKALPASIFNFVAQNLNCEDIAMSFFVSSLTSGKPPLLAPYWAGKSQVKLFHKSAISDVSGHMDARNTCVDMFAEILEVKDGGMHKLITSPLFHNEHARSHYGALANNKRWPEGKVLPREEALKQMLTDWTSSKNASFMFNEMVLKSQEQAQKAGLVEKTTEWQQRFFDTYGVNDKGKVVQIGPGTEYIRREDGTIEKVKKEKKQRVKKEKLGAKKETHEGALAMRGGRTVDD